MRGSAPSDPDNCGSSMFDIDIDPLGPIASMSLAPCKKHLAPMLKCCSTGASLRLPVGTSGARSSIHSLGVTNSSFSGPPRSRFILEARPVCFLMSPDAARALRPCYPGWCGKNANPNPAGDSLRLQRSKGTFPPVGLSVNTVTSFARTSPFWTKGKHPWIPDGCVRL